jgi:hydroxymethylpyrimidine pyrophosphatase-like HAD family hydrolase
VTPADSSPRGEPLLLACDLDGTLLDYESRPVPGAGEALAELVRAGALFAVVTGRPLQSARRATAALGVDPVVYACCHGALVAEADGTVARLLPVPRGPGHDVTARALTAGAAVTVWDVDEPRELAPGDDVSAEPGGSASRLVVHGDPDTVTSLLAEFREEWAGRLRVSPIRPGFLGVFAPEVDKGDALLFLAERLGVPMTRTVACGDGEADATLLAAAAVRVAVGEEPHELGHLEDVVVTGWASLPAVLRDRVLPLLRA